MLGDILETHPGIRHLIIEGKHFPKLPSFQGILYGVIKSRVNTLKLATLDQNVETRVLTRSSIDLLVTLEIQVSTQLKQLWFDANLEDSEYYPTLLALLRHSPFLRRLRIPAPSKSNKYHSTLASTLRHQRPKLQHLDFIYYTNSEMDDGKNNCSPEDLVQGCSGHLQSLTLRSDQDQSLHLNERSIQTIIHHQHSRTLERLDIKSIKIEIKHLQLILTTSPNLTSFSSTASVSIYDSCR